MTRWIRILGLVVVVMVVACGNDGKETDGSSSSVVIGTDGGEVKLGAAVTVTVPPGALAEETTIRVSETKEGFDAINVLSPVYVFEPTGLAFEEPVTVTIAYDPSLLGGELTADAIRLAWRDEATGLQLIAPVVDTDLNTISAEVAHFSRGAAGVPKDPNTWGACCGEGPGQLRCGTQQEASCTPKDGLESVRWLKGVMSCTPNPCYESGACCDGSDGSCRDTPQPWCEEQHRQFIGGTCGTIPEENPCTGACCYSQILCEEVSKEKCERELAGEWVGLGAPCEPNPCGGACCNPETAECTFESRFGCENVLQGEYVGDGTQCAPGLCDYMKRACCTGLDGTCSKVSKAECDGVVTTSQHCDPNPCQGACCDADGACTVGTAAVCALAEDYYVGDGTVCDPNPCASIDPWADSIATGMPQEQIVVFNHGLVPPTEAVKIITIGEGNTVKLFNPADGSPIAVKALFDGRLVVVFPRADSEGDYLAILGCGSGGCSETFYYPDTSAFGMTIAYPGMPNVTDALPLATTAGGAIDAALVVAYSATGYVDLIGETGSTTRFYAASLTEHTGNMVSAWAPSGDTPILVVTDSGELWRADWSGGTYTKAAESLGSDLRRIRCLGTVCGVTDFGSSTLTLVSWDAPDAGPAVESTATVGSGAIGLELAAEGANTLMLTTGYNDGTVTLTTVAADFNVVSSTPTTIAGCTSPAFATFLPNTGGRTYLAVSCYGSNKIQILPYDCDAGVCAVVTP